MVLLEDRDKTKEQLIEELSALRRRVSETEGAGVRPEPEAPGPGADRSVSETRHARMKEIVNHQDLLAGHSRDVIFLLGREDGHILEANSAAVETYGYSLAELLTLRISDLRTVETRDSLPAQMATADESGILFETRHRRKNGSTFPVEVSSQGATIEGARVLISVVRDITERKNAEQERSISIGFLSIINECRDLDDMIRKVTAFIQRESGCEAIGIRLKKGDDYPYYQTSGFPQSFVLLENSLCARDDRGNVVRDEVGNPLIECMCGNVICGRFDPSKPFFTGRGSFWTNCTTKLLAETSDADRQTRTRNRCNGEGYESVALIALKTGDRRLGLLQLNDRRQDRFSAYDIALWERLADYLSVAVSKLESDENLSASEKRYRSLFGNMLEGFAYCKVLFSEDGAVRDFIYLAVNDSFEKLTGLKGVGGKRVSEVIPGIRESDPAIFEVYGRVATTGVPEKFETYLKTLGIWFAVSVYSPEKDHFVAVFDVITDRKDAEEALRRSERTIRALMNAPDDVIFLMDSDGRLLAVNEETEKRFARTRGELLNSNIYDLLPPALAESRKTAMRGVIRSGKPVRFEDERDGRWLENMVYPIADGQGRVGMLAVYARDVTSRKTAENALKKSEEKYRNIFENAVDGIFQANPEGYFISVNPSMAGIHGYSSPEEMIAAVTDIERQLYIDPEDRRRYKKLLAEHGTVEDFEAQVLRKDGVRIWTSTSSRLVKDGEGNILYSEGTVEDITARKESEKTLKEALKEKEILLREIHHRVKNNMQVMSSLLNLQTQHLDDPKALDIFRTSIHRIRSMALIHDKLYRSESLSTIHFPEYVSDLLRGLFAACAPDAGVELNLGIDPLSLNIDTAIPLGLIINELVSNSLKHAFPGGSGGAISVSLRGQDGHMVLTVSDNGSGFPEELDFMNTESMGMQLVVTLVEQLEGTITLERRGETKFEVTFRETG